LSVAVKYVGMLALALVAAASLANEAGATIDIQPRHICWITDVVATDLGVRIYFPRRERIPAVVTSTGIFRVADAPVDPKRPEEAGLEASLGDRLSASNSPEDGCSLLVVKQNGQVGLQASAFFNPPGLAPTSREEFIPASHE
jgi:hypothetical protein